MASAKKCLWAATRLSQTLLSTTLAPLVIHALIPLSFPKSAEQVSSHLLLTTAQDTSSALKFLRDAIKIKPARITSICAPKDTCVQTAHWHPFLAQKVRFHLPLLSALITANATMLWKKKLNLSQSPQTGKLALLPKSPILLVPNPKENAPCMSDRLSNKQEVSQFN